MDNLSDIVTLVRVVESGSFVAAAQGLGVTPSAVSKSVSRLEERLGVRLLNRTTRSLSLTDAGNSFYTRCRDLVGQLSDAAQQTVESLRQSNQVIDGLNRAAAGMRSSVSAFNVAA